MNTAAMMASCEPKKAARQINELEFCATVVKVNASDSSKGTTVCSDADLRLGSISSSSIGRKFWDRS